MFRFYKTILNLKTRFFHYHLNLFLCCKTKLKIKFMFYTMRLFYRMNFFLQSEFFLTELNFLKRDTNIYFKQTTFFEKNHTDFFLKNMFFLYLVLLHLNNHRWLLLNSEKDHSGKITSSKFPILRVVTTIVYKKTDEWYIK